MNNQRGYLLNNIPIPVWSLYEWVWLGEGKKQVSCPTRELELIWGGDGGETNDDEDENSEGGEGERRWETNDDEDEYSHGDGSEDGNDYGDGDDCPESCESTYAITTPVFCRAPM